MKKEFSDRSFDGGVIMLFSYYFCYFITKIILLRVSQELNFEGWVDDELRYSQCFSSAYIRSTANLSFICEISRLRGKGSSQKNCSS